MSEYAKNIQTIEDLWKKRIKLRDRGGRMSEYIYRSNGEPLANERGEILLARAGEIVRCRDCAYICNHRYANGLEWHTCGFFDSRFAEVEPDGFCAWAERRVP